MQFHGFCHWFLAHRTQYGRAYAGYSVACVRRRRLWCRLCIVAKRCVLEQSYYW